MAKQTDDEVLARQLHLQEVQSLRAAPSSAIAPGSTPTSAAASCSSPAADAPSPRRDIHIVIDGMNVGRHSGFFDSEYENVHGAMRQEFDAMRRDHNETAKPLLVLAVIAAIDACLAANDTPEAKEANVVYHPMVRPQDVT